MNLRSEIGLTFDDVLLVPKRSPIRSRSDVDTTTYLVPGFLLAIPLVSSNMDTVTEAPMAIAMAQAGGIGIIHRFMTIEQQSEQVRLVKRAESFIVENPITISMDTRLADARKKMVQAEIGGLVVVDEAGRLLGLLTSRDVLLASDDDEKVQAVMTPRERLVVAMEGELLDTARLKLHQHRIEKLPLVDADNRIKGLITAQDIVKLQQHPNATKDEKGRLRVGVAIGVHLDDKKRAAACVDAGADVLVVDVAHGHADHVMDMVRQLKHNYPTLPVVAGNVATGEGVKDLGEAGADAVKVGVGSGSICITRVVTGYGVPQLSAIADCAEVGRGLGLPIIADGGVRTAGDFSKALAAGASTVMLGSALAGTDESPGAAVIRGGRRYKMIRGMASLTANVNRKEIAQSKIVEDEVYSDIVPEGVEAVVPYRGEVSEILHQFMGGLRSAMSYGGARTLEEFWKNADFIRITTAGKAESGVHDVDVL